MEKDWKPGFLPLTREKCRLEGTRTKATGTLTISISPCGRDMSVASKVDQQGEAMLLLWLSLAAAGGESTFWECALQLSTECRPAPCDSRTQKGFVWTRKRRREKRWGRNRKKLGRGRSKGKRKGEREEKMNQDLKAVNCWELGSQGLLPALCSCLGTGDSLYFGVRING